MRVQGDERGEYERSESVEPAAHERARLRREQIRGGRGRVSRGGWRADGGDGALSDADAAVDRTDGARGSPHHGLVRVLLV